MEERVLFPTFEARTGNTLGPTEVMRSEHADMRGLLGDLSAAVGQHDSESFLALSDTLLVLLQQHNLKEEQVLYPMTEEVLGVDQAGIMARMQEISATDVERALNAAQRPSVDGG